MDKSKLVGELRRILGALNLNNGRSPVEWYETDRFLFYLTCVFFIGSVASLVALDFPGFAAFTTMEFMSMGFTLGAPAWKDRVSNPSLK